MTDIGTGGPVWEPPTRTQTTSHLQLYMTWLADAHDLHFTDYPSLWQWSVDHLEDFWQSIWDYFDVIGHAEPTAVLGDARMPGAEWFPGAMLNYAEHALRHEDRSAVVIEAHSQTRPPITLTRGDLIDEVGRVQDGLRRLGVQRGDRVVGYVANIPEAVITLLACAGLGAVWSACPPEFGTQSVLDRIAQIEPKVLIAVDGYQYGEKMVDRRLQIQEVQHALPGLEATVVVPYLGDEADRPAGTMTWSELRAEPADPVFTPVPFDHPLWILFSSGTTGLPKAIVHGHGGIVLEHLKMGTLMQDIGPGDTYFFFSTTAWMVWNRVVSTLLAGAKMVILDGDPTYPRQDALFALVAESGVTNWGVSAAYLSACIDKQLRPGAQYDFSNLREVIAAGSPVSIQAHAYMDDHVKRGVHFASGSGGTDVCTGFASGNSISPVYAGRMSGRVLGVSAHAFNADGVAVLDEPGELVVTKPMPSMPVSFWGDPDGSRMRDTYFDVYPGIWRHGDLFVVHADGSCNVLGRSDATLNRGGVRLGSGEFYDVIEALPEVADSLVVHLEDGGGSGELILFLELAEGVALDDELVKTIAGNLRMQRSPRHVPDIVYAAPGIPRTLTGKKLEVPVKRLLQGHPLDDVASAGSVSNPEVLAFYDELSRTRKDALRHG